MPRHAAPLLIILSAVALAASVGSALESKPGPAKAIDQGRQTFRYDTFGDEAFWGDTLGLHKAIEGSRFNGVGPGVSPRAALGVGLKVDVDALPSTVLDALRTGAVNLDDPAVTLQLLALDAVVG